MVIHLRKWRQVFLSRRPEQHEMAYSDATRKLQLASDQENTYYAVMSDLWIDCWEYFG